MKKGFFICLEGPDGSGKSTLCAGLTKRLIDQGLKTINIAEPGTTTLGKLIRSYTKEHGGKTTPETLFLLFNAARSQLISEIILPALEDNTVVVCDRFIPSTIVFQACLFAKTEEGVTSDTLSYVNSVFKHTVQANEKTKQTYDSALGIIPDITFFIKRRTQEIEKSVLQRESKETDFFESCSESMRIVRSEYNKLMHSKTRSYMSFTYTREKMIIENIDIDKAVTEMADWVVKNKISR